MGKENKEEERSELLLGPDNNIDFLKHFCAYHTEKLMYRDVTCFILIFCHEKFAIRNKNMVKNLNKATNDKN